MAAYKDRDMYEVITEHEVILSKALKKILNYGKGGNKGFDTIITRLQMQGYVSVADFVYMTDKFGKPYGWVLPNIRLLRFCLVMSGRPQPIRKRRKHRSVVFWSICLRCCRKLWRKKY